MEVVQALPISVNTAAYVLQQAQSNDLGHGPIALH